VTAERFQDIDIGEWYRFVDVDGDSLYDLFAESPLSDIRYYRNTGTKTEPRFVVAADTLKDVQGAAIYADRQNIAQFADIDCNGKLDMMLGRVDGTITRYEMEGMDQARVPRFRLITEKFEDIQIIGQRQPSLHGANTMAVFDIDGDGSRHSLGDFFEPGLLWLRNQGSCAHPDFHGDRIPFPPNQPIETSGYNAPTFGDLNGDGRADVLMGVLGGAFNPVKTSAANLYEIDQTAPGAWTVVTSHVLDGIDLGSESIPAAADIDGDGDLDLVVGTKIEPANPKTGGVYWFENIGSRTAPRFQLRGHLTVLPAFHEAPALGDLDGDGLPDLVIGQFGDAVAWYRNSGSRGGGGGRGGVSCSWIPPWCGCRGSVACPSCTTSTATGISTCSSAMRRGESHSSEYRDGAPLHAGQRRLPRCAAGRRAVPGLSISTEDGVVELIVGSEAAEPPRCFVVRFATRVSRGACLRCHRTARPCSPTCGAWEPKISSREMRAAEFFLIARKGRGPIHPSS
jgi:hypothetical protein